MNIRTKLLAWTLVALSISAQAACSASTSSDCEPGDEASCTCDDGSDGFAVCSNNGSTYGECQCEAPTTFSAADCDTLKSMVTACVDSYCLGDASSSPFCGCYGQGMDLNMTTCQCVPLDLDAVCQQFYGLEYSPSQFSCSTMQQTLDHICPSGG